jgi:hypothetical protein
MGRPRKVVTDTTTKPKRKYTAKKVQTEQESSKSLIEDLQIQVEQLTELLTGSIEAQLQYHQVATEAEDKFKALAKETESSLTMMLYHCDQVQATTGSLTAADVEYSVNLLKRIIEYKFKKD